MLPHLGCEDTVCEMPAAIASKQSHSVLVFVGGQGLHVLSSKCSAAVMRLAACVSLVVVHQAAMQAVASLVPGGAPG